MTSSQELITPHVNIHELFVYYDYKHFSGMLQTIATVSWSKRMKTSAGMCKYKDHCLCIYLSEPILKFRTNDDIKSTLLHEMIHAYQMITHKHEPNGGHGPIFKDYASRIGYAENLSITVYHNFIDEVMYYKEPQQVKHRTSNGGRMVRKTASARTY